MDGPSVQRALSPSAIRAQAEKESNWNEEEEPVPIGRGVVLKQGSEVAILAYGYMVNRAMEAAEFLKKDGVDPTVVNMRFVKPLDTDLLQKLSVNHHYFVTYEDHSIEGGFSSAVAEAMMDMEIGRIPLLRLALPDLVIEQGTRNQIFEEHGLLPSQVTKRITNFMRTHSHAAVV